MPEFPTKEAAGLVEEAASHVRGELRRQVSRRFTRLRLRGLLQRNLLSQVKDRDCYECRVLFPGKGRKFGHAARPSDHPSIARTLDEVTEALGENVLELDSPRLFDPTVRSNWRCWLRCRGGTRSFVAEGGTPEAVAGMSAGAFAAAGGGGVLNLPMESGC